MSATSIAKRALREPAWIVFWLSSIGYILHLVPGVLWMDVGELAVAAATLGGAHPPGHPAHSMLGKLATLVPVGEIATRLSWLSALAAAASLAGLTQLVCVLLPKQRLLSVLVVLPMALSPALLVNATRPEVYTLLFAFLVWAMVYAFRFLIGDPKRGRDALLSVFLLALAATVHPAIAATLALPLAIVLVASAGKRSLRLAPIGVGLCVLAAFAYLYLPARALAASPPHLMWADPSSFQNLYDLMSASVYQKNFGGSGFALRLADRFSLLAEGTGFILCLVGYMGLGFGALTRLRGAGWLLLIALIIPLAGALQSAFNPDMRAYLAMTYVPLSLGVAIVAVALSKVLPANLFTAEQRRWSTAVAIAPVLIFALRAEASDSQELDRSDDAMQLWDESIGAMPPGPGIFFANGDHLLFVAQYEALVAGARPDIVIANQELVRDRWFLEHLRRRLPADDLYLPFLDDGRKGNIAGRLFGENSQLGRPVWTDLPTTTYLRAERRAFALRPSGEEGPPPPPPLAFSGYVGRRVAGLTAHRRARYEMMTGNLRSAVLAAGIEDRIDAQALQEKPSRPSLLNYLPQVTERFLYEEFEGELLTEDILWQLGVDNLALGGNTPEQQIHFAWRLLLSGDLERGNAAIAAIGEIAEASTTRMLVAIDQEALARARLEAALQRSPDDVASLITLASLLGNTKGEDELARAQELFVRATELAPNEASAWVGLGLVFIKLGRETEARDAWHKAWRLEPNRADVKQYLDLLERRSR